MEPIARVAAPTSWSATRVGSGTRDGRLLASIRKKLDHHEGAKPAKRNVLGDCHDSFQKPQKRRITNRGSGRPSL
jgi:hypothetical protein